MNIYVSNLSFNVREEDLRSCFAACGEVNSVVIITDKETGRSKGFAFVEMTNENEAQKAIQQLDQSSIDGRQIKVSEARPKTERSFDKKPFNRNNSGENRRW
ncbi:RNA-binding protein [Pseudoflavitalea sp. G-6-1-2]|uniref:RNA recognition motif domain-containing protein n=1 Tax=Pseudoflavitalea sp. G-6-1-2 TaxID=2728841 RepID=UPI00146BB688|nr:RNA-binding protein [Pseudoflavitalea sp. G-6-1-2]NML23991.1 RNA-binding protein [Pseudoflavitalea sp. G-6-1-2]